MATSVERELRFLKGYAVFSSLLFLALTVSGFSQSAQNRFREINVERINLREPDGKLDLVISSKARFPDPIVGGRTLHRNGDVMPGMIFYNAEGDEDGGLIFGGQKYPDGHTRAGAEFLFDQYHQDQTVGITYSETDGRRSAGFRVWDRSDRGLATYLDSMMAMRAMPEGPDKTALLQSFRSRGLLGTERVFVGKRTDRSSAVVLSDAQGNARIVLAVDSAGAPKIELRDAAGRVLATLP
jgi:hypothetical protein